MWRLCYLIYMCVGYKTNIDFEFANGWEFYVGTIVVGTFLSLIDKAIYVFAFRTTGATKKERKINRKKMQNEHWFIRMSLSLVVFALSHTPLFSNFLNPVIHSSYISAKILLYSIVEYYSNAFTEVVNKF